MSEQEVLRSIDASRVLQRAASGPQRILIVDDREENLFALKEVLAASEAVVVAARSGNEALRLSLTQDFALAILDVQMPEMDGYELAELLRSDRKTAELPIIFLSAIHRDHAHIFRGFDAGAVDYITKPFEPRILLSKVRVFLELDQRRRELLRQVELERSKSRLENILLAMSEAVVVLSPQLEVESANPAAMSLLGRGWAELSGMSLRAFMADELAELSEGAEHDLGAAKTPSLPAFDSLRSVWLDARGRAIPVLLSSSPVLGADGVPRGTVLVAHDLTELTAAEESLKALNESLARSNEELRQFAYVASHDLQEPLRTVEGFAEALVEDYEGRIDETADGYIRHMVDGVGRMRALITDLLALSGVGSQGQPPAPTDSAAVMEQVLGDLEPRIAEQGAAVEVGELPWVTADPGQLGQVFQNLLSNAIKFRGEAPPLVEVRAEREGAGWAFTVSDNGIGVAPEHHEQVFVMFRKLHRRQEYPGTGIGLAIVKKIIERHGGELRLDSTLGEGARFTFTLPAAEPV